MRETFAMLASSLLDHNPVRPAAPAVLPSPGRLAPAHSPLFHPAPNYLPAITPQDTEFLVFALEGPDPYCRAGGLGVRVTELTRALAERGFATHYYFVGDPDLPGNEKIEGLPLWYHRWSQWLSRHYPHGVYHGEEAKRRDLRNSLPDRLIADRIRPAVERGRRVVILSEEWHTADVVCDLSDALWRAGLRDKVVMVWNANNPMGFHGVDFGRLCYTQTLSTVSRWMKQLMWGWGCDPLVIPNGIPARRLLPNAQVEQLCTMAQSRLKDRLSLIKVARFDPDKRWLTAVEAAAGLNRTGLPVLLIARGGMEEHGHDVLRHAGALGLRVRDVRSSATEPRYLMRELLTASEEADLLNVQFHLSEPLSRALYHVADAALQNSGREPFGLVGLEAMAAGGLVFTGCTGEEYARPQENAIVLDTGDPREIQAAVLDILERPALAEQMRRNGVETARQYTWDRVVELLLQRLKFLALQPVGAA
jgi:glycosyltransferase involved in cell wall biosynthesis